MFTYSLVPTVGAATRLTREQFIAMLPLRSGSGSIRFAGWYRRWTLAGRAAEIQITFFAKREGRLCDWCDAPIDTEKSTSELCDDCSAVACKHIEEEETDRHAYWRHVNQQIDEARGK